jgi:hypothetical protein
VANVNVGKKQRVVVRRPRPENISISEHTGWVPTKKVIADITRDKEAREYFKAIKTSCQYFQVLGKQLLGKSIQERFKLEHIINCLHSETIIDDAIHKKLHDIRVYRNKIELEGIRFKFDSEEAKRAEGVAEEAVDMCKLLEAKKKRMPRKGFSTG